MNKNAFANYNFDERVRSYISKTFKYLVGAVTLVFLLAFITLIAFISVYGIHGFAVSSVSLTSNIWDPDNKKFGIGGFLLVSLMILFFALTFSLMLAIPYILFLKIYFSNKSKVRKVLERLAQMLTGIPSVIFGLIGFTLLHGVLKMNLSVMMTSIVLAIMILPNHILFMGIYMATVTDDLIHNSLSLGVSKLESVVYLCFRPLLVGLLIGTLVAITRILSETMAVSMILGNSSKFSWNIFAGARNLTSLLAMEFGEATGQWQSALYAVGLIVLILSFSIHFIIFLVQSQSFKKLIKMILQQRIQRIIQRKYAQNKVVLRPKNLELSN